MSYQADRDRFIDTMAREGLPHRVILQLLREATGINRRAELACSSEAADRDRVPCPAADPHKRLVHSSKWLDAHPCLCDGDHDAGPKAITRITLQDWHAPSRPRRLDVRSQGQAI